MSISVPWGAFPSEQYLIRHWDWSFTRPPASNQRRDLIRAFVQLDGFPREWDATGRLYGHDGVITRVPTEKEVSEILAPWRSLRWREAALRLWRDRDDEEIWLRTCYNDDAGAGEEEGKDSDTAFKALRDIDEDYDPNFEEQLRDWTILDDRAIFEVKEDGGSGDDWSVVLDVLPELLQYGARYNVYSHRLLGDGNNDEGSVDNRAVLERLRQDLGASVASALRLVGCGNEPEQLRTDAVEAGGAGMALQAHVVGGFLMVADAEALRTSRLRLLFLDGRGAVVREARVPVEQAWELRHSWHAGRFVDQGIWADRDRSEWGVYSTPGSVLGWRYGVTGDLGRILYGLEE